MRYPASEKLAIIQLVEGVRVARCAGRWKRLAFRAPPSTAGTRWIRPVGRRPWTTDLPSQIASGTRIPDDVRERIIRLALDHPALPPRELAVRFTDTEGYFVSEASVYRLLKAHDLIASPVFIVRKAADEFKDKTTAPNQLWQTDFTYLKVIGWGWFSLSTVLDDFARYIIAWKLCTTMKAADVTATLKMALDAAGLDKAKVLHRPRLLSDNGSSYFSDDQAKWLERHNMAHVRGAPYHPMTQGKTLKNRILLENYYLPGDLEAQIEAFVADYNHRRYHESINNLTPADVYFGRGNIILLQRERIKRHHRLTPLAASGQAA
jgi:transposase InsO family protein